MTPFQLLMLILQSSLTALSAFTGVGAVGDIAKLSVALTTIVQQAQAAHIAATGKPIDPSLIKPYVPIDEDQS